MRKVRCVSPHGGAHNGMRPDGTPAPPGYSGPLALPAREGGYLDTALGVIGFGDEVDAPEPPGFIADGFHFVNEDGTADECGTPGPGCWCGRHKSLRAPQGPPPTPAPAPAAAKPAAASTAPPVGPSAKTPPSPQGM